MMYLQFKEYESYVYSAMMKHSGKNKLNLKLPAMDSSGQANHENNERQLYSGASAASTGGNGAAQSSPHTASNALPNLAQQPQTRHRYPFNRFSGLMMNLCANIN